MANNSEEHGRSAARDKPAASRPSLLGSPPAEGESGGDPVSILSAVKPEPRAKRAAGTASVDTAPLATGRAPRWPWLALGLAVAIGLFLWLPRNETGTARTLEASASTTRALPASPPDETAPTAPAPSAEAAATEVATATATASADAPPQTATIESALEAGTASTGSSTSATASAPASAPISAQTSTTNPPPNTGSLTSNATNPSTASATTSSPAHGLEAASAGAAAGKKAVDQAPIQSAAAKPAFKPAPAPSRDKARKSEDRLLAALNQSATPGKSSEQRDIDLIEALLAHSGPASAAGKTDTRSTPKILPAGPKVALLNNAPRDVAERKPGASTAELIRKCEEFGALEGLLCRIRICNGLWGKDAACPAKSAPAGGLP